MGGHAAGEVASKHAADTVRKILVEQRSAFDTVRNAENADAARDKVSAVLETAVNQACLEIFQMATADTGKAGMGTTLVVALFYDNKMLVAHLGDSRLYRLRGEQFRQVTRDHSLLQEQIDSGLITPEQAKHAAHKNLVTKALGIDPIVEPEIHEYPAKPGDVYLLCSDGLCDMVDDDDIGMTLQALGGNLKLAAQQLVQMANDNGGKDNVSVILVRILRDYPAPRGFFGLFK